MSSVRIVLRKKKNSEGKYPLAIRIHKDKKTSYIYIGQSISLDQWDDRNRTVKRSHPNSSRLNNLLVKRMAEVNDTLIEAESHKVDLTASGLKRKVTKKQTIGGFNVVAKEYLKELHLSGKQNQLSADHPRINRFKEFLHGEDIAFKDISVSLIRKFQSYLRSTRKVNQRPITERTVVNHLVVLRTLFNRAIEKGLVDSVDYPFGRGRIKIKFPDSIKVGLSRKEVEQLEQLDLIGVPRLDHARNLWLISFYFAGMRVSDVLRLKWSDIQENRLFYKMGKNQKGGSFTIVDKAMTILERYRSIDENPNNLVFPELKKLDNLDDRIRVHKSISNAAKLINEALEQISKEMGLQKPLRMHIARHTFGNLAGDKIPIQMLQKLYRHSSILTTINYQANFINAETDEALRKVLL